MTRFVLVAEGPVQPLRRQPAEDGRVEPSPGHVLVVGEGPVNPRAEGPAGLPLEVATEDASAPGIVLRRRAWPYDAVGLVFERRGGRLRLVAIDSEGGAELLVDSASVFTGYEPGLVPGSSYGDPGTVLCGDGQWRAGGGGPPGSTATKEVPTGAVNGTNVTFTMAAALGSADLVFTDGLLDPDAAAVGTTLTVSAAPRAGVVVLHFT